MKKITLIAACLAAALSANAQDYYKFSKSTGVYSDLTAATSMNNGQVWNMPEYGPFKSSFPVTIYGDDYTDFGFIDYNFIFADDTVADEPYVTFFPISVLPTDRNFSGTGTSQSSISYKTEGTQGSRILKMEIKNGGLEKEMETSTTSTLYFNYQIWFYEADKSIEYHVGANNITSKTQLNDTGVSASGFFLESDSDYRLSYVDGTVANPLYVETQDPDDEPADLGSIIPANTVYRFELNTLALKDQEKITFTAYPNPVHDKLNLNFAENVTKPYSVYDMLGREVLKGTLIDVQQAAIETGSLQNGNYILRIGGTTKKFVKK